MSRIKSGILCLAAVIVLGTVANAQQLPRDRAPVPRQVLSAKTVFIGNGGGDSYGADTYYRLTKFDGGPDRAYNSFYSALKEWGHYDVVGSTDFADLALVIRFTNPAVDRQNPGGSSDLPHDWIYDPQLNLSMNDPHTGLALWSITEHIEPSDDRPVANRHFDEAVTRLVGDLQRLILDPNAPVMPVVPPGAVIAATRYQREMHAGVGLLLGTLAGTYFGARSVNDSCNDFNNLNGCFKRGVSKGRNILIGSVSGAIAGALIGWVWPTHVELRGSGGG
jgi:hypothetical protein